MKTVSLGGEEKNRDFLGTTLTRTQKVGIIIVAISVYAFTMTLQLRGIIISLVFALIVLILVWGGNSGTSIVDRIIRDAFWRDRKAAGLHRFEPIISREAYLQYAALTKDERPDDWRQRMAALRLRPDACEAMGWLQAAPNIPGIAWHTPPHQQPYLSVAFSVGGQVRGIQSDSFMNQRMEAFGRMIAGHAKHGSLVDGVQCVTRVLPPDSALHELWVTENLADVGEVPHEWLDSYAEVIRIGTLGTMIQRHALVMRFPLNAEFLSRAKNYGADREGWRRLMEVQNHQILTTLKQAGFLDAAIMTASQVVAWMLHAQNPCRPLDKVDDVDPRFMGFPSVDDKGATCVNAVDDEGAPIKWWHSTVTWNAGGLEVGERNSLWMRPLITNAEELLGVHRTVTTHLAVESSIDARARAGSDYTNDLSNQLAKRSKGALVNQDDEVKAAAAKRRMDELAPGSGVEGLYWAAAMTVSAPTRTELVQAKRAAQAVLQKDLGVNRFRWADGLHSAALGLTFPLARGLQSPGATTMSRIGKLTAERASEETSV